jgi:hypothetical protein
VGTLHARMMGAQSALPGTRQASAPAPGVRLELGPLGRCPRPLPRAPTLDKDILVLMMAFWGPSPAATAAGRVGSERIRCRGVLRVEESKSVVSTQEPSSSIPWN